MFSNIAVIVVELCRRRSRCFPRSCKQVTQWCGAAPSGLHVSVCAEVFVSGRGSFFARMHPLFFFCFVCVCVCVHMCASDFCCLCNKTPEVSRRLSGVTEKRTELLRRKCFCVVAPLQSCALELLLSSLWRSSSGPARRNSIHDLYENLFIQVNETNFDSLLLIPVPQQCLFYFIYFFFNTRCF